MILPIVPVKVSSGGKSIETYALLDNGSTISFCAESLKEKLQIRQSQKRSLNVETITDATTSKVQVISLECKAITGKKRRNITLPYVNVVSKFPDFSDQLLSQRELQRWSHLKDLPYPELSHEVELLIGLDVPDALMPLEVKKGIDGPYAVRTALGWTVNGPTTDGRPEYGMCNFVQEVKLDQLVEKFWKVDGCNENEVHMSKEDRVTVDVWNKSIKQRDGHYELDIPFRDSPPPLMNNKPMAEARLQHLSRKFQRHPGLHEKYKVEIDTLLEKGYAEKCSEEGSNTSTWYLPHHNVVNPKKPEKTRVVFDCAAEYRGTSLNKVVMQGPDFTNNLVGVLLRFRLHPVAVMADVEAMFHQVAVTEQHRDVLRFLWWPNGDVSKEPESFRMTRHLFGGIWSPSCASFALKQVVKDYGELYDTETAFTVNNNFYVDDCLKSVRTEAEAEKLVKEVVELLARGGFRLTKWLSSSRSVLKSIPEGERAKKAVNLDLDFDKLPVDRALGVHWDPNGDSFMICTETKDQVYTRRGLLRTIGSVYDPLGFVCPVLILVKKIFQGECRRGLSWDEIVTEENKVKLNAWLNDLQYVENLKIPRCMIQGEYKSIQLHVFADASSEAYGAVAYLRVESDVDVQVSFVMAKGKLAPMSNLTIPRLELSAAVVAVGIGTRVIKELSEINIAEVVYWSDSMIVLQYLKNKTKRFQTFVANRITRILDKSDVSQWRHVPTKENPADIVSRGAKITDLLEDDMWLHGPEFLKMEADKWPQRVEVPDLLNSDKEVKKCNVSVEKQESRGVDELLQRFSSWFKLKKCVAWLRKFIVWIKNKSVNRTITVQEMSEAETAVLKYVQRSSYPDEVKCLSVNSEIPKSSVIYSLDPFTDTDGVLRVRGRLRNATLPYESKYPAILPNSHHVTILIIRETHEYTAKHMGKEFVLSALRRKYWVPQVRPLIRRILKECMLCKMIGGKLCNQRMADLPLDRVQKESKYPFHSVGLDVFGPFMVKRGRSQEKRYGCIFTCLNMRAVHLETLSSLETDSFLNGLLRFISRRGAPTSIRSDQGTNFIGADAELSQSIEEWNKNKGIQKELLIRNITWKFNTPAASHMGGVWERMIRSVRKVLDAVLKGQVLTDEKLNTYFCQAESILNSRPLTAVSDDVNDYQALTPNDLLHVSQGLPAPPGVFVKQDVFRRNWRHVQVLADNFWK